MNSSTTSKEVPNRAQKAAPARYTFSCRPRSTPASGLGGPEGSTGLRRTRPGNGGAAARPEPAAMSARGHAPDMVVVENTLIPEAAAPAGAQLMVPSIAGLGAPARAASAQWHAAAVQHLGGPVMLPQCSWPPRAPLPMHKSWTAGNVCVYRMVVTPTLPIAVALLEKRAMVVQRVASMKTKGSFV